MSRSKALTRVRRGSYVESSSWSNMTAAARARTRVRVVAQRLGPDAIVSHTSAALMHGLPAASLQTGRPHATWPGSPGRRSSTNVIPHRSLLADDEITVVSGVRTTTVARTLFDLARAADPRVAVAIGDAALRLEAVSRHELARTVDSNDGRPGAARARHVLAFVDARAESVGESMARVQLRQLGIPRPELQAPISTADGRVVARVDFLVVDLGTVIEFDGRVKYGKLVRVGETAADVVYREKVREDLIRSTGLEVVRMVWQDLADDAEVLARCAAAFARRSRDQWVPSTPGLVGWATRLR